MIFLFEKNIRFLTRRRIKYIRLQETDKRTFLIWKTILHERKGISKYSFRVIFHKYTGHPLSFSSFHDSLQYRYIYTHIQCKFWKDTHRDGYFLTKREFRKRKLCDRERFTSWGRGTWKNKRYARVTARETLDEARALFSQWRTMRLHKEK